MRRAVMALGIAGTLGLVACGDNLAGPDAAPDGPPDADTRDLLVRLNALPGVTADEQSDPADPTTRRFELEFTQPVDHFVAGGQTFTENVTLVHRGFDRPMIAVTTGYWNFYRYYDYELTALLAANQIVIEHRFFAGSRPSPTDWTKLTIAQAAADEHHIIELLKTIYPPPSKWITTGASKGGMTATYHRRFYPDDVDASVPYVAPLSLAAGDPRYASFLDTLGPPTCRQALRDLEVELLTQPRFDAMLARAMAEATEEGFVYNRVAIGPAVEGAIVGIEWAWWQYIGAQYCNSVPPTTASDTTMWDFLQSVDAVSGSTDDAIVSFEAYYYQAGFELGYPDGGGAFLAGLTRYTDADYVGIAPIGVPAPVYTPDPMADIDQFVQTSGERLLFIYGEWDPWTGGKYELGAATDALLVIAPQMTHGAGFLELTPTDRDAAYAKIEAWSGVTPDDSVFQKRTIPRIREPRIPPAMIRALRR